MVKQKKRLSISNKFLYALITLGIIIVLAVGVYAVPGSIPNPGHSLLQLQVCSPGETIVTNSNNQWACTPVNNNGSQGNPWTISGSNVYYTAGAVGIGTSSPAYPLDVVGWLRTQGARVNTIRVDNQTCLGSSCINSWAALSPWYTGNASSGLILISQSIGITPDIQYSIDNQFVWQTVTNPNPPNLDNCYINKNYALCSSANVPPTQTSQIYEADIPLDPTKGAVVGISLEGSSADDSGACVAGFPGYFFIIATRGDSNLNTLDLNGNFNAPFTGDSAGQLKRWNWLIPDLPPGSFKGQQSCGSGCYDNMGYIKAPGINYVPPGKTLVVRGQYRNSQGVSGIDCQVSVVYAPPIP